jgi:hypothetical protein
MPGGRVLESADWLVILIGVVAALIEASVTADVRHDHTRYNIPATNNAGTTNIALNPRKV